MDEEALTRLLIMSGLSMAGAKGNPLSVLSQGGLFGMQDMGQQKLVNAKLYEEQQQAEARAVALQRAKVLQQIMLGGGEQQAQPAQRSIVDAPDWTPRAPQQTPAKSIAQKLFDAGFIKEAEDAAKAQGAIHGEAYGNVQVTASGRAYYMTKQGPRYVEDNSFVPREELHFADTGDRVGVGMDKFTGKQVSPGLAKGMSPAEADAARRGWSVFGLDKAKFDRGELRDAPMPDGGTGLGWVTPGGFSQVPGTGVKMPEQPAMIRTALAQNDVTLQKIGRALQAVEDQPSAFGLKNVMGDTIRQRTNPEGVDARAMVADIGSQKIHDRSGAAVTVSEAPRLTPFVPNVNDSPATITKKLQLFQREYAAMHEELTRGASINSVAAPPNKAVGKLGDKLPAPAEIEAELMRRKARPS